MTRRMWLSTLLAPLAVRALPPVPAAGSLNILNRCSPSVQEILNARIEQAYMELGTQMAVISMYGNEVGVPQVRRILRGA